MNSTPPAIPPGACESDPATPPLSSRPIHTIRLGPPWEVTLIANGSRLTRKFGRPRALDANERLWLICALFPGGAEVVVNGIVVGASALDGAFAADITSLLRPRNEVAFTLTSESAPGAISLEVRPA